MASLIKNIAHQYDSSKSYEYGDYVIYEQMLYMCISDTTAAFDAECWKEVYLTDIVSGKTDNIATEPKLLWENPNPSSAFSAQTIYLDLSEYAGVIVEYNKGTTINELCSRVYIKMGESDLASGCYTSRGSSRPISLSNNGVIFGDTKVDVTTVNNEIIPTKIYGVKNDSQIGNSNLVKNLGDFYGGINATMSMNYGGVMGIDCKGYTKLSFTRKLLGGGNSRSWCISTDISELNQAASTVYSNANSFYKTQNSPTNLIETIDISNKDKVYLYCNAQQNNTQSWAWFENIILT